jgi:hypothetical protein
MTDSLTERMNSGIEDLIAKLEAIKAQDGRYMQKATRVQEIADVAKNYADYWIFKLEDWAND